MCRGLVIKALMESKEFRFQGVDARTEWRLGLILFFPAALIFISFTYGVSRLMPTVHFFYSVVPAAGLTVVASTLMLKLLAHAVKDKQWIVNVEPERVRISYKNHASNIPLDAIRIIKNRGNTGFRYVTIITRNETIKMRVGSTGFVPFSAAEDVAAVDAFIAHLKPYIDEHFKENFKKLHQQYCLFELRDICYENGKD
jgi:hypothetical protein